MSFLTALSLSFNNLRTKKARTLLTSFAGSIGIIGIALILHSPLVSTSIFRIWKRKLSPNIRFRSRAPALTHFDDGRLTECRQRRKRFRQKE